MTKIYTDKPEYRYFLTVEHDELSNLFHITYHGDSEELVAGKYRTSKQQIITVSVEEGVLLANAILKFRKDKNDYQQG